MKNKYFQISILLFLLQIIDFAFYQLGHYTLNNRLIFGLIGNNMIALAVSFFFLIAFLLYQKRSRVPSIWPALIIAGVLSNCLDRLVYHGTIDYIRFFSIPDFNLADILIAAGLILLALNLFKNDLMDITS